MSKRRREQTKRAETETEGVYEVEQILDKVPQPLYSASPLMD